MTFNQFLRNKKIKLNLRKKEMANNFLIEISHLKTKKIFTYALGRFLIFYGNEYQLGKKHESDR